MCSVTLPKDGPRNSDQLQCHALPYIVSHSSTLEWCVPCVPSCLKFYLSYKLFPLLNSCFTVLFNYFGLLLCFLSATNQPCSHFSLCYFTIKPPVHRRIRRISHLHNCTFRLCLTLVSLSCPSAASLPKLHPTSLYFAPHHPVSPYNALFHIKSDSFRNPPYLLYHLYFIIPHRLLKKGSTSPCTIIHFAGSSHCKCIITHLSS